MKFFRLLGVLSLISSCEILPSGSVSRPTSPPSDESNEFATLMEKDKINKDKVTAEVLTYLLNESDSRESRTAVVVENKSNCDLIFRMVRLNSNLHYNLPVARNSKNQFVIEKGKYTLKSKVCNSNYYSQKSITEPLILKLSK